jgi:inactivated superfamily I helicase
MSAHRKLWRKRRTGSNVNAPEGSHEPPRLYTIPPSAPFLTSLAKAVLDGDLPVPGGPKPDRLALPHITIYLPTRRAARGLREAFLAAAGDEALLLPRIRALGDPDEDQAIIFGADGTPESGLDASVGAPAIGALERRLTLMRLILAWGRAARGSGIADPTELPRRLHRRLISPPISRG